MAIKLLVGDTDEDFMNATNYDPAVAPTHGDIIVASKGDHKITVNVASGDHALTHMDFWVGDEFTGQLGQSGTPFSFTGVGATKCEITFDAPKCAGMYFSSDLEILKVLRTKNQDSVLQILGGTCDEAIIRGGVGCLLAAAGTFSLVKVNGPAARVVIENGNTVPLLHAIAGKAVVDTLCSDIQVYDGVVQLRGTSKTYPKIETNSRGALVLLECAKSTITLLNGWAGTIDGRKGEKTITISGGELHPGATMLFGRHVKDDSNIKRYGGRYEGWGTPTQVIPMGGVGV